MTQLFVKICGITTEHAVAGIKQAQANAVGFVFDPNSRRCILPGRALELAKLVPPSIKKIGVFVDTERDDILRIAEAAHLDWVQLHGESAGWRSADANDWPVKVFSVGIDPDGKKTSVPDHLAIADWLLLDTRIPGKSGGTGITFNWHSVPEFRSKIAGPLPIMLAGGLTPENVSQAICIAKPDGVDVSSGVEVSGVKNTHLMRTFTESARASGGCQDA